jgi:aldehyde:ferredoxin oxidoreductase
LRVDLSSGETDRERVPEPWRRRYLGGKGLGARYLYEELSPGTEPRDPASVLGFLIGPLSGYLPGPTRYAAVTKSPLTGGFLDSYSGGSFAERLVGSLDDCLGVLVTGAAEEPVRIELEGGDARVEPARTWGKDTAETAEAYPGAGVACIGPAGEHGVAYATIASDGGDHHAGRGGAGAVMGAKGLKAVVARDRPVEAPPGLAELRERYADAHERDANGRWLAAGGTIETVDFANEVGILATEGWQRTRFEGTDDVGIEAAIEAASGRERGSEAVPGDFRIDAGEDETVPRGAVPITLGAGLGIDEFGAVAELGGVCDRLGLDVISAGNAVAWAIRARERGLVDCGVEFGDADRARALIEAIGTRSDIPRAEPGLPDELADGIDAAAATYGGAELVPTVKSMALPGFDPRRAVGMALAYATSDRGGCHRRARPLEREPFEEETTARERVAGVIGEQNARSVLWSLVADDFVGETLREDLGAEWLRALGYDHDSDSLTDAGERIWTLVRLFNAREGFDRTEDTLPEVFRTSPDDADARINQATFERLLDLYYAARGWGADGLPTPETVSRLDLSVDDETPLSE